MANKPLGFDAINFKSSTGFANNVYYIEASSHAEIAEYRKSSDDDGAQFACFRFAAKRHALENLRLYDSNLRTAPSLDPVKLTSFLRNGTK